MGRAYAEEGAVIISDDGRTVKYHPQCPDCGNVERTVTCSASVGSGIRAFCGGCTCGKCRNYFTPVICRDR